MMSALRTVDIEMKKGVYTQIHTYVAVRWDKATWPHSAVTAKIRN